MFAHFVRVSKKRFSRRCHKIRDVCNEFLQRFRVSAHPKSPKSMKLGHMTNLNSIIPVGGVS